MGNEVQPDDFWMVDFQVNGSMRKWRNSNTSVSFFGIMMGIVLTRTMMEGTICAFVSIQNVRFLQSILLLLLAWGAAVKKSKQVGPTVQLAAD
jgi:uncharacterized membrane protein